MVLAWYMDTNTDDQRLEHHRNPSEFVSENELKQKSGVLCWKLDADNYDEEGKLKKIKEDRGYNYEDFLECSREKLANYDEKLKTFFKEHLHSDEEIRFILDGSGYFDVRDKDDQWIRILVTKGDLVVLPAGIYHRFTLDTKDYIKVMRLFCGQPVWAAINRPADDHPARSAYLQTLDNGSK